MRSVLQYWQQMGAGDDTARLPAIDHEGRWSPLDTIVGTPGNDTLTGTAGNDDIDAGAGNDDIDGGNGADVMKGGSGNDRYRVSQPGDVVVEAASQGNDTVYASVGYRLGDYVENLVLVGNGALSGAGNSLANQLTGNNGNNTLSGAEGRDTLVGGGGNDSLRGGVANDSLVGGTGNDSMYGDTGDDAIVDDSGLDADTIDGGSGVDKLTAYWGDATADIVWVNDGTAQLVNGHLIAGIESVDLTLGSGNDVYLGASGDYDTRVDGGDGNDSLAGSARSSELIGGIGDDTLRGGGGPADTLDGGLGDDAMYGGNRGDSFTDGPGDGVDTIDGGGGVDVLTADWRDAGSDIVWINDGTAQLLNGQLVSGIEVVTLLYGAGNDVYDQLGGFGGVDIDGGAGNDSLTGGASTAILQGGDGNDTLIGGTDLDFLYGGSGDDLLVSNGHIGTPTEEVLQGGDGNDTLIGGAANDSFEGGAGDDSMSGGDGDDLFFFYDGTQADTVDGGDGVDYFYADWSLEAAGVNVTLDASNQVYGIAFDNFERYELALGKGRDTVVAGDDDTIDGGGGNDLLTGGRQVAGGSGDDSIEGGAQDNAISGDKGSDTLSGGDGSDVLSDIEGANRMTGGAGADLFVALGRETASSWAVLTNTVLDFDSSDHVAFARERVNSSSTSLSVATVDGPGGFDTTSSMVIVTTDIAGTLTASAAAAAIGGANGNYLLKASRLFVVDNGTDSAVFQFKSTDTDALVEANELSLLTVLVGVGQTAADDFQLI